MLLTHILDNRRIEQSPMSVATIILKLLVTLLNDYETAAAVPESTVRMLCVAYVSLVRSIERLSDEAETDMQMSPRARARALAEGYARLLMQLCEVQDRQLNDNQVCLRCVCLYVLIIRWVQVRVATKLLEELKSRNSAFQVLTDFNAARLPVEVYFCFVCIFSFS